MKITKPKFSSTKYLVQPCTYAGVAAQQQRAKILSTGGSGSERTGEPAAAAADAELSTQKGKGAANRRRQRRR